MMNQQRPPAAGFRGAPTRPVPPGRPDFQLPTQQELEAIILKGDARTLVASAETLGAGLARQGLATSQIRGVFGAVRRIEMMWPRSAGKEEAGAAPRQLLLLKPKLAYQAERDDTGAVAKLRMALEPAINLVSTREQFGRFVEYFEAILAYHKAAHGKD